MFLDYISGIAPFYEKGVITLFIFLLFCQKPHPSKPDTRSLYFLKELKELRKKVKGIQKSSTFILLEKCHENETLLVISRACCPVVPQS